MKLDFDLYFITDRKLSRRGDVEDVRAALAGGVRVVQYRQKDLPTRGLIVEAFKLRKPCAKNNALFLVNDRVDVALAVGADGVHLGQDDMPLASARKILGKKSIIGVTVHNVGEAVAAEKGGANYLGVSPIFATATKADAGKPGGLALLREVKSKVKIPCVGIGGINEGNMMDVLSAGADGVAMISAIVVKDDVAGTVKRIRAKILSARK